MNYYARIEGVYRHRTRINFLFFSVAGPWKSETFTFERMLAEPLGEWTWQPMASLPVSVSAKLSPQIAEFRLRLLDQPIGVHRISLPVQGSQRFHFEPVKGNIVEGTASVQRLG
jgi:hypothetical protein